MREHPRPACAPGRRLDLSMKSRSDPTASPPDKIPRRSLTGVHGPLTWPLADEDVPLGEDQEAVSGARTTVPGLPPAPLLTIAAPKSLAFYPAGSGSAGHGSKDRQKVRRGAVRSHPVNSGLFFLDFRGVIGLRRILSQGNKGIEASPGFVRAAGAHQRGGREGFRRLFLATSSLRQRIGPVSIPATETSW